MAESNDVTRNMGVTATGKVWKGHALAQSEAKPVSSIPAKFETVLHLGPREKKGFMSMTRRFNDPEPDMPGPGTYIKPRPASEGYKDNSIGKKGYGAMVSRDQRFRKKIFYTGPGPCDYEPVGVLEAGSAGSFNRAPVTSAFHGKVPLVKELPAKDDLNHLGPGTYEPTETARGEAIAWDNVAGARSAFKAPSRPPVVPPCADSPSPSAYKLDLQWETQAFPGSTANSRAHSKIGGTSSFAKMSNPASLSSGIPGIIFPAGAPGAPPPPHSSNDNPGPGAYNIAETLSIKTKLESVVGKSSAAFARPEYIDRFTAPLRERPTVTRIPGPGAYFNEEDALPVEPSLMKGVSSAFKSTSPGHARFELSGAMLNPGPAYYGAGNAPVKKSFHLNAKKQFVSRA